MALSKHTPGAYPLSLEELPPAGPRLYIEVHESACTVRQGLDCVRFDDPTLCPMDAAATPAAGA